MLKIIFSLFILYCVYLLGNVNARDPRCYTTMQSNDRCKGKWYFYQHPTPGDCYNSNLNRGRCINNSFSSYKECFLECVTDHPQHEDDILLYFTMSGWTADMQVLKKNIADIIKNKCTEDTCPFLENTTSIYHHPRLMAYNVYRSIKADDVHIKKDKMSRGTRHIFWIKIYKTFEPNKSIKFTSTLEIVLLNSVDILTSKDKVETQTNKKMARKHGPGTIGFPVLGVIVILLLIMMVAQRRMRNKRLLAMRNRTTSAPQTSQSPITTNVAVIHNPELFTEMLKPPPYAPKDEYTEAPPPPYTDVTA